MSSEGAIDENLLSVGVPLPGERTGEGLSLPRKDALLTDIEPENFWHPGSEVIDMIEETRYSSGLSQNVVITRTKTLPSDSCNESKGRLNGKYRMENTSRSDENAMDLSGEVSSALLDAFKTLKSLKNTIQRTSHGRVSSPFRSSSCLFSAWSAWEGKAV